MRCGTSALRSAQSGFFGSSSSVPESVNATTGSTRSSAETTMKPPPSIETMWKASSPSARNVFTPAALRAPKRAFMCAAGLSRSQRSAALRAESAETGETSHCDEFMASVLGVSAADAGVPSCDPVAADAAQDYDERTI